MTQTSLPQWNRRSKKLYRAARQYLFDTDGNWLGDDSPYDIKAYWANLTDTQRAFEKLERTDAAMFMEFVERLEKSIPKPHIAP